MKSVTPELLAPHRSFFTEYDRHGDPTRWTTDDEREAIRRQNMDFYLNHFLLYEDTEKAEAGVHPAGMFLGYWFIRKAMWASRASYKSDAASLKKFYAFTVAKGKVTQEDLDDLQTQIKEEMPEWLATLGRYDDPDIDDPAEIWGL